MTNSKLVQIGLSFEIGWGNIAEKRENVGHQCFSQPACGE